VLCNLETGLACRRAPPRTGPAHRLQRAGCSSSQCTLLLWTPPHPLLARTSLCEPIPMAVTGSRATASCACRAEHCIRTLRRNHLLSCATRANHLQTTPQSTSSSASHRERRARHCMLCTCCRSACNLLLDRRLTHVFCPSIPAQSSLLVRSWEEAESNGEGRTDESHPYDGNG